jgi:hypothetical protein
MLQSAVNMSSIRKNTATPGMFEIKKGYSAEIISENYNVRDPVLRGEKVDYLVSVLMSDKDGNEKLIELRRRYSDFFNLRVCFVERYPGIYIPPVPGKKYTGSNKNSVQEERTFILNIFLKNMARCPYIVESTEFKLFLDDSLSSVQLKTEFSFMTSSPYKTASSCLSRIIKYFNYSGAFSSQQMQ